MPVGFSGTLMCMSGTLRSGYADRIQRVVDYIESNLSCDLLLEDVAKEACWSTFHFMRTFGAITGFTFREYVRNRRLEIAAYRLSFSDERVLDIAMSVGYETQQAFTRAFKRSYGVSPGRYRVEEAYTMRFPRVHIVLQQETPHRRDDMEPRIVQKDEMTIMGVELRTRNDGSNLREVPEFWERFWQEETAAKIPGKVAPDISYGLCTNLDPKTGEFSYVIGYEVASDLEPTQSFGVFTVPEGEYAVFSVRARTADCALSEAIQDMWKCIYGEWFVDNPTWDRGAGPDYELYDATQFSTSEGACDICIPVRRK